MRSRQLQQGQDANVYNRGGDVVNGVVTEGTASAGAGYADMTKDELAAELESRGLAKSGNKDELVARLEEDDAA